MPIYAGKRTIRSSQSQIRRPYSESLLQKTVIERIQLQKVLNGSEKAHGLLLGSDEIPRNYRQTLGIQL